MDLNFKSIQPKSLPGFEGSIGACGTVIVTRKEITLGLRPINLSLKKGDPPKFMHSGDLVASRANNTALLQRFTSFLFWLHSAQASL